MKINIIAIGKLKESYWKDALAEYVKRISRFADIFVVELDECLLTASVTKTHVIETESARLLSAAKGYLIVLDIDGKPLTSPQLAEAMQNAALHGYGEISFLIGGSLGISDAVKQRCNMRLSFGKVTFPHQLVRVMCAEQVYRALTINNNVPYHK